MSEPCHLACSLLELTPGQEGVVDTIELEPTSLGRLLRLGLTPGRRITLMRKGRGCIVSTAGARIALDKNLAAKIFVVRNEEILS
ncbi:MAG: FeoA family protein [Bdellovibrionota bacterium]|jgi:Fe2+ transport system protein FeoA